MLQKQTTGPYGIIFFAAPEEGYALSAMTAPNSAQNYFTVSDGAPDGTGSEFLNYELDKRKFPVSYSNVYVTDEKTGNDAEHPIPITTPADLSQLTQPTAVTAYTDYIITSEDVEAGGVTNQASLHYQYQSEHSKGTLDTTSDAQAEITVHASVRYQYVSGTAGLDLPEGLAALTPTDLTYYNQNAPVEARIHPRLSYWDEIRLGYWTPENGGAWISSESGESIVPGGSFSMPGRPVTLTARWVFTPQPAIAVSKSGTLLEHSIQG